jgi:HlyD family secretion protein
MKRILRSVAVGAMLLALTACGNGDDRVFGSGTVEATDVVVSAEVAGRVTTVDAEEGSVVQARAVLVRIDPEDYELELEQGRQRLRAAEAELSMLVEGAREEDLLQARAEIDRAREALSLARRTYERTDRLFGAGSATQSDRDAAETAYRQAQAGVQAAEAAYRRLLAARPGEIQRGQARVEEARIAVARFENRLRHTTVVAPRDGTVITRFVEEGEYVAPGTPLVRIADLSAVSLTIYIDGPDLSQISLGQEAEIVVDGVTDRTFGGRVGSIADEAEFTPRNAQTADERAQLVYAVEIAIPNPDGVFKIGMPADAYLERER